MNLYEELKWRGLIKDITDEEAFIERLKKPLRLYCGFDPTADSLHIGSLQQILLLRRYQLHGHTPIALIGDATGMIGDPRPTTERKLLTIEEVRANGTKIKALLARFLEHEGTNNFIAVNNYDWLSKIDILSFLRDYGKHFNVAYMINKDTISSRLSSGISFTEFTYTILQAVDFMHLYQKYDCEVQIGGSDQWGNLTSGTELIRRTMDNAKVFGVTSPLITNTDGSKFGKSEGENIWLNAEKTSPYAFYQYWLNVSDSDVIDFMKRLSMKSPEEIMSYEAGVKTEGHLRTAQKALAEELTELVHGLESLTQSKQITEVFFSGQWRDLNLNDILAALSDAPSLESDVALPLIDVLIQGKLAISKREARDLIEKGSISVNGEKIIALDYVLSKENALHQHIHVLRKGKKNYFIMKLKG
ncbi:MAG: tyrosyl-tRNA synthetase [Erysipelotrichaceae bacterium]|nr:MAG: tyrosyl-tRNA [Erysipelotrichaceae bacterium]TXT19436.1 MAG: tyrosyl-tRNA synthetase [Erysipelotrichaceae bacterium]